MTLDGGPKPYSGYDNYYIKNMLKVARQQFGMICVASSLLDSGGALGAVTKPIYA